MVTLLIATSSFFLGRSFEASSTSTAKTKSQEAPLSKPLTTLKSPAIEKPLVAVEKGGGLQIPLVPKAVPPVVVKTIPLSIPPLPPKTSLIRPPTGTNLSPPLGVTGRGTLTIDNGTDYDAAVTLLDVESNAARRFVYVRSHNMAEIENIVPGDCRLYFALGRGWDGFAMEFDEVEGYSVFDERFRFTETKTDGYTEWSTFSVTLHPVLQGKAKTSRLSKREFENQVGIRTRNK